MRAAGHEDLALGVPGLARGGAHRVGGFLRQQRFVAVDGVDRLEAAGQVLFELLGADLHGGYSVIAASRRMTWATTSVCISR